MCSSALQKNDYTGIPLSYIEITVTDDAVDDRLNALLDAVSWKVLPEASVQYGDQVHIGYSALVGGLNFVGSENPHAKFTVGNHDFFEDIENAMIGHQPGDTFVVNFEFPENHVNEALSGRMCEMHITLKELARKMDYQVTDEYVAQVSDFSSVEEIKREIYFQLTQENEEETRKFLRVQIENKLADLIPDEMIDTQFQQRLQDVKSHMHEAADEANVTYEDYLLDFGSTIDEAQTLIEQSTRTDIKVECAVAKIAEIENIVVTEEEITQEVETLMSAYEGARELEETFTSSARNALLRNKIFDFILQHAILNPDQEATVL